MSQLRKCQLAVVVGSLLLSSAQTKASDTVVAQSGDASISHAAQSGTWSVSAGGTTLVLALDPSSDFSILRVVTASSHQWNVAALPGPSTGINGMPMVFGNQSSGFVYHGVTTEVIANTLQLDAAFDLPQASLRVTRHFAVASGSPTFEVWNTYEASSDPVTLSNVTLFRATFPSGAIHSLTGLQGDNADTANDNAFTLRQTTLAPNEHFAMGAQGRASEQFVPWLSVDALQDEFFVALMWSGAWGLSVDPVDAGLSLSLGLGSMSTRVVVGSAFDTPHILFGAVPGGLAQSAVALRSYVLPGVRNWRTLTPQVTYNTWFAHGVEIDDATVRGEILRAAALGVERFVVDAGWYRGAGVNGRWDFDTGLGDFEPDPERFPNGLKPLADYAHSLGMQFGLWVEPERVNLATVGDPGVDESWLATSGGAYGSDHAAQVCFASDKARQFVLDRLTALIDTVQPDYLKWDNNMWINCDREGHGHGSSDGNFTHVRGLYSVLDTLRARYPQLQIENVSGGGNRLDLGILQYTDIAWMDDRTAPSARVRHNIQGLTAVFPPAYLLSFVTDHPDEPLHRASDLSLMFRSRMQGVLGLSFDNAGFSGDELGAMATEIALYKTMRDTVNGASGALLSLQASGEGGPPWDVLQESAGGRNLLVSTVQTNTGVDRVNLRPIGLDAATRYAVSSVDLGDLGVATGADLMAQGIDVFSAPNSAAHILRLVAMP